MSHETEAVSLRLPVVMRDKLSKLASASERTFAAEVRVALREYLERKEHEERSSDGN